MRKRLMQDWRILGSQGRQLLIGGAYVPMYGHLPPATRAVADTYRKRDARSGFIVAKSVKQNDDTLLPRRRRPRLEIAV
jgi:hypothetical protein